MTMMQNGGLTLQPPKPPQAATLPRRRIWLIVLSVLGVFVVLPLGFVFFGSLGPVSNAELVGSWVSADGQSTSTIVLRPDGTADVGGLAVPNHDATLTFTGTWYEAPGGTVILQTAEPIEGTDWQITVLTNRSLFQPHLVSYSGLNREPGDEHSYSRK